MPRLSVSLLRLARAEHAFLPLLLRTCRDLPSARNELRWLDEYVHRIARQNAAGDKAPPKLLKLCQERGRGRPLQYILGNQPFGNLDILCRKHVLIPRNETENYTLAVAELLKKNVKRQDKTTSNKPFRILDLCTGSGCIALCLHAELASRFPYLTIIGVDISEHALALARRNLQWNIQQGRLTPRAATDVHFVQADLLQGDPPLNFGGEFDLIISNPPYIPSHIYRSSEVSRSVRHYEPRLALEASRGNPADLRHGLEFYARIHACAKRHNAKLVVSEIGQADQVAGVANKWQALNRHSPFWETFQVWHDNTLGYDKSTEDVRRCQFHRREREYFAIGKGLPRVTVAARAEGLSWLARYGETRGVKPVSTKKGRKVDRQGSSTSPPDQPLVDPRENGKIHAQKATTKGVHHAAHDTKPSHKESASDQQAPAKEGGAAARRDEVTARRRDFIVAKIENHFAPYSKRVEALEKSNQAMQDHLRQVTEKYDQLMRHHIQVVAETNNRLMQECLRAMTDTNNQLMQDHLRGTTSLTTHSTASQQGVAHENSETASSMPENLISYHLSSHHTHPSSKRAEKTTRLARMQHETRIPNGGSRATRNRTKPGARTAVLRRRRKPMRSLPGILQVRWSRKTPSADEERLARELTVPWG
jgi:HemK-like putative methylase